MAKKKQSEYQQAKKRLEKAQAKYIQTPKSNNKPMTMTEKKNAESRAMKSYHERVWRGWRESDGKESPVITYNIKDLEE